MAAQFVAALMMLTGWGSTAGGTPPPVNPDFNQVDFRVGDFH